MIFFTICCILLWKGITGAADHYGGILRPAGYGFPADSIEKVQENN